VAKTARHAADSVSADGRCMVRVCRVQLAFMQ
jgi:hypothetical protein